MIFNPVKKSLSKEDKSFNPIKEQNDKLNLLTFSSYSQSTEHKLTKHFRFTFKKKPRERKQLLEPVARSVGRPIVFLQRRVRPTQARANLDS